MLKSVRAFFFFFQQLQEALEAQTGPVEQLLLCKQQEINTILKRAKRAAFVTYASRQQAEQALKVVFCCPSRVLLSFVIAR